MHRLLLLPFFLLKFLILISLFCFILFLKKNIFGPPSSSILSGEPHRLFFFSFLFFFFLFLTPTPSWPRPLLHFLTGPQRCETLIIYFSRVVDFFFIFYFFLGFWVCFTLVFFFPQCPPSGTICWLGVRRLLASHFFKNKKNRSKYKKKVNQSTDICHPIGCSFEKKKVLIEAIDRWIKEAIRKV